MSPYTALHSSSLYFDSLSTYSIPDRCSLYGGKMTARSSRLTFNLFVFCRCFSRVWLDSLWPHSFIKGFILSRGKEYAIGQTYFICPPIVETSSALKRSLQIYFTGPLNSSFISASLLLLPWSCNLQRISLVYLAIERDMSWGSQMSGSPNVVDSHWLDRYSI